MIFRIYSEKSNTVAKGSNYEDLNSSQNPVTDLWYGGEGARNSISRHLLYFDLDYLQEKIDSKQINPDLVTSYRLRMKNCIPGDRVLDPEYEYNRLNKSVASSFDLIAFPVNMFWDEGRGFDLEEQKNIVKYKGGNPVLSGYSNWLSATSISSWTEPGVYNNPTASTSYWSTQHFSIGNEDLNMDITDMVKNWLSGGSENYGLAVAYSKYFEDNETDNRNISSFFTNKTNTAFKPFIEVQYNQSIKDDRTTVYNNRPARLFLYLFSGNSAANYFSAGTVNIKNSANVVVYSGLTPTQFTQGAYYVDVFMSGTTKGQRYYDVWQGITMTPGMDVTDYTQKFDIKGNYYTNYAREINDYVVDVYGISNNEIIVTGDVKRIYAETRVNYSLQSPESDYGLEFNLIMNNGTEIIPWTAMNSVILDGCLKCYFDLDTNMLLDNQIYKITMRINELGTKRTLPDPIYFRVMNPMDNVIL